ncbi:hypothetical protein AB0900_31335 [Streptomyces cellulosae]
MTGIEFRETHGDPAQWDDDEYEAYLAITADQTPDDYQPAA